MVLFFTGSISSNILFRTISKNFPLLIRGQSDKYLASPPDGVTIAREIYYRVVHSRRRLVQSHGTWFVYTADSPAN